MALLGEAPIIIAALLWVAGFYYKELYLLYISVGLWINSELNELLNDLVPRAPRIAGCLPPHGAAFAWQIQQMAFFTAMALSYAAMYRPRTKLWHVLLLLLLFMLTVIGSDMLNYQHTDAIVSGAAIGSGFALLFGSAGYFFFVPWFSWLLHNRFVRYMGYEDKMCTGNAGVAPHIVVLENFDAQFPTGDTIRRTDVRRFIAKEVN